jgi:hypothetical protein
MDPDRWTTRRIGASLANPRCVRVSLYTASQTSAPGANAVRRRSRHDPSTRVEASRSAFNIWVLPRRSRCDRAVAYPHRSDSVCDCLPKSSIIVADQIHRRRVPRKMPPRSAALATPPSDAWLPRTTTAVVDHGSPPESRTSIRTSESEPHRDQPPRWHSRGCVGMSATTAMAVPGV